MTIDPRRRTSHGVRMQHVAVVPGPSSPTKQCMDADGTSRTRILTASALFDAWLHSAYTGHEPSTPLRRGSTSSSNRTRRHKTDSEGVP